MLNSLHAASTDSSYLDPNFKDLQTMMNRQILYRQFPIETTSDHGHFRKLIEDISFKQVLCVYASIQSDNNEYYYSIYIPEDEDDYKGQHLCVYDDPENGSIKVELKINNEMFFEQKAMITVLYRQELKDNAPQTANN